MRLDPAKPGRDSASSDSASSDFGHYVVVVLVGQYIELTFAISALQLPYDVGPARAFLGEAEKTPLRVV